MSTNQKYKLRVLVAILVLAAGCSKDSPSAPETFVDVTLQVSYTRFDPTPGVPREGREYLKNFVALVWRARDNPSNSFDTALVPINSNYRKFVPEEEIIISISSRGTRFEFNVSDPWRWTGYQGSNFVARRLFFNGREVGSEFLSNGSPEYAQITLWPDGSFTAR